MSAGQRKSVSPSFARNAETPTGADNQLSAFFGQGAQNIQDNFKNMYDGLNKQFSANELNKMKVNADGTMSMASATIQDRPKSNLGNFNPGEYL